MMYTIAIIRNIHLQKMKHKKEIKYKYNKNKCCKHTQLFAQFVPVLATC